MSYVGGKRQRLIKDNVTTTIRTVLDDLGYFQSSRPYSAIQVITESIPNSDEIKPNVVAVSAEDIMGLEQELGSGLEENRWTYFLDIYAEKDSLGLSLAGDIRDALRGKMSSIGRTRPHVEILDYSTATPTRLFFVQVENVDFTKVREWNSPIKKVWYVVRFEIVDTYDTDED